MKKIWLIGKSAIYLGGIAYLGNLASIKYAEHMLEREHLEYTKERAEALNHKIKLQFAKKILEADVAHSNYHAL